MGSFLNGQRSRASSLGDLLSAPEPVLAPGAYDALSARLIEAAGFPAVYMTGFGTAASLLGRPDVGAIHIEDQVAPKKCGHMEGKQLVPAEEMVAKVRAAVAARRSELVLIARTDARAVEGMASALERARSYRDAGADVIFFEAPQTEEEIETVATELADVPLLFNWAEGGKTPSIRYERLRALGFRIIIFPIGALLAATRGIRDVLSIIRADGTPARALSG